MYPVTRIAKADEVAEVFGLAPVMLVCAMVCLELLRARTPLAMVSASLDHEPTDRSPISSLKKLLIGQISKSAALICGYADDGRCGGIHFHTDTSGKSASS